MKILFTIERINQFVFRSNSLSTTPWFACLGFNMQNLQHLSKIRSLQNKAISVISEIPPKERASPYYHKLQIPKLDDLYQFEVAKFMHRYTHNKLPIRFCNYFTYSCNSYSYSTRNSSKDTCLPRVL